MGANSEANLGANLGPIFGPVAIVRVVMGPVATFQSP